MSRASLAVLAAALILWDSGVNAAIKPPDQEIRETTEKMQALIRENHEQYKAHPDKFYEMVDEVVVPHFDQKYIGQIVLGRSWRTATEQQRNRFVAAFKNSLVHSYADAMLERYNTVKANWKPVHVAPDATEATVGAELQRKDGPPIQIGFSVRKVDNDWKVYDVMVEGISLAANFRSQFSAEVKQHGLDALTQRLESGGKPIDDDSIKDKISG